MFIIILAFIKRGGGKKGTEVFADQSTACARVIRLTKHTKGHFLREEAQTVFLWIKSKYIIIKQFDLSKSDRLVHIAVARDDISSVYDKRAFFLRKVFVLETKITHTLDN